MRPDKARRKRESRRLRIRLPERTIELEGSEANELHEGFEAQRRRFVEKFGRETTAEDPIFFDPQADTPKSISLDRLQSEMVEGMVKAGLPPDQIYAFRKTGLLASAGNWESSVRRSR